MSEANEEAQRMVQRLAENGAILTDQDIARITYAMDKKDGFVRENLKRYFTIDKQSERIAYLEQRVMEQREEIQRLRNGV